MIASKQGYANGSANVALTSSSIIANIMLVANSGNHSPVQPWQPTPDSLAVGVDPKASQLSWLCSDPDGDPLTYDLYFGSSNPPTQIVATGISDKRFSVSSLDFGSTYYWSVVAHDSRGALAVGPVWSFTTAPQKDYAISFGGSGNGSVAVQPGYRFSDRDLTVEAWVRPLKTSAWNWVVGRGAGDANTDFLIGVDASGVFRFQARGQNFVYGSTRIVPSQWYHIIGVLDLTAGTVMLYVNGQLDGQRSVGGATSSAVGPIVIGARTDPSTGMPTEFFSGEIDDIRIWNRALTSAEVALNQGKTVPTNSPGLQYYWKFDEGSGNAFGNSVSGGDSGVLSPAYQWVVSTVPSK